MKVQWMSINCFKSQSGSGAARAIALPVSAE